MAVGWDPEGILAAPKGGHISRRQLQKQIVDDKELQEQMEKERQKARAELQARREARKLPETQAEIVEFFLETESDEMEFEVARCRPLLTEDLFAYVQQQISEERFKTSANQDRVAELELLLNYLKGAVEKLDSAVQGKVTPLERMKKLLTSKDKKATLLEMAGNNEIDTALLDLLQQNIDGAKAAGQKEPAEFMEKIRDAARKFVMTV
ncbi:hypothetical protein WJX75_006635 [Coccomyxa subellipsoidea]|uniref:Uncharacterized protein n=1 Tax=Coccomyxa subellipsoidea TaxID=248742 RepID=A0ABR2YPW2_9CHLO